MCSRTLPRQRKNGERELSSFVGGRVRLQVGCENSFELFYLLISYFEKFSTRIWLFRLPWTWCLNSLIREKGPERGGGQQKFLQLLHHKCFLHWAAIKLPNANWPVKILEGRRKGELQSHEKSHRCGSFLLIQHLIYSIKHRGAYLISNVSDAVFIRGRFVFQNHIS